VSRSSSRLVVGEARSDIVIRARVKWNPTGVLVNPGERYRLEADGRWSDLGICADADGFPSERAPRITRKLLEKFEPKRRMPAELWFCLIGTVGEAPPGFFRIGRQLTEWVVGPGTSGELLCFANDVESAYWNNFGSLTLTVTRTG